MAIDSVTMGVSCLLLVPATLFMATNKKVAMNAVKEAGLESSINDNALALAAYYLFLVGGIHGRNQGVAVAPSEARGANRQVHPVLRLIEG